MKKIMAFVIATVVLCGICVSAHPFTDVGGHWAEEQLDIAYNNGMINGDPDGRFRPDDNISRAEYLKMLTAVTANWLEVPNEEIDRFEDESHWAAKYYQFALYQGWVINYSYEMPDPEYLEFAEAIKVGDLFPGNMDESNFDLPIERWEMAYLASRFAHSLCGASIAKKEDNGYADYAQVSASFPEQVTKHISCSFGAGYMTGDPSGNLNALDNGTRAEAAVIVNRYINSIESEYQTIPDSMVKYENIPEGHPVAVFTFSNEKVVEIELYPEYAPQTVAHFVAMVNEGVYNEEFNVTGVNREEYPSIGSLCSFSTYKPAEKTVYGEFRKNGYELNTLPHLKGTAVMTHMWNYNDGSVNFKILAEDMTQNNDDAAAFGKVISGMDFIEELSQNSEYAMIQSVIIK